MGIFAAQGDRLHQTDFPELTSRHPKSNRMGLRRCMLLGAMILLAAGFLLPAVPSVFRGATATESNRLAAPLRVSQGVPAVAQVVDSVSGHELDSTGGEAVVIGPGHTVAAYR